MTTTVSLTSSGQKDDEIPVLKNSLSTIGHAVVNVDGSSGTAKDALRNNFVIGCRPTSSYCARLYSPVDSALPIGHVAVNVNDSLGAAKGAWRNNFIIGWRPTSSCYISLYPPVDLALPTSRDENRYCSAVLVLVGFLLLVGFICVIVNVISGMINCG